METFILLFQPYSYLPLTFHRSLYTLGKFSYSSLNYDYMDTYMVSATPTQLCYSLYGDSSHRQYVNE